MERKLKMKKKLVLAISVFLMLFCACGSSESADNATDEKGNTSVIAEKPISEDKQELSFESFDAVNNKECRITVKDLSPDELWGYGVKLELENKSTEKSYMFSAETGAINGVKSDPFFASEVAPGKKSLETLTFTDSVMKEYGVHDVTDILISFRVYDYNDWSAEPVAKEIVHIYPFGEEKAVTFIREPASTDIILAENEDVSIRIIGFEDDPIWGYSAKMYMQNKTNKELMFSVEDASVNGYMCDPFFAVTIAPNLQAFSSASWSEEKFKECGITEVETIELTMRVYDFNDWTADDVLKQSFTIKP